MAPPEELAAAPEDRWKHSMPGAASNFGFRSVEVTNGTALITLNSLDYIKSVRIDRGGSHGVRPTR